MEHHVHCISCVNQTCTVKSEQGVSCEITACLSVCGAVFHSCKGDEHQLLCPLKRVPCLNGNYGCPAMMLRNEIPAHLDVCPAGVVFCVERWNVHPTGLLELEADRELGSVLDKIQHHRDLALALEDRQALFETLEDIGLEDLAHKDPVIYSECKEIQLTLSSATQVSASQLSSFHQLQSAPKRSRTEEAISRMNCLNDVSLHKLWNAKAETARSLTADLDFGSSISCVERNSEAEQGRDVLKRYLNSHDNIQKGLECTTPGDGENCSSLSCSDESGALKSIDLLCKNAASGSLMGATEANGVSKEPVTSEMTSPVPVSRGVAQWAHRVVLDDKGEFLQHNLLPETMLHLKHFSKDQGQYPLCSGQLDVKPRRSLYRPGAEVEDKAVDTLELNWTVQQQTDPVLAVLFCLENCIEFRGISDTVYVDDYHVDFGTQTFVPCTYPLICGQSFRRDEYSSHYRNIHCDFHPNFRDRIESHCPLALYGCRFSQQRLYPTTQGTRVVHHKHLKAFGIQPCIKAGPATDSQSDWFSGLPIEILRHMAGFLDSFSLCQLSLVSRTMREVCASLLPLRGIVELQWERGHFPGRPHNLRWRVKNKVWRFSPAFTPVSSWGFVDVPNMSDHIRKCPFFNRAVARTEPVPLIAMSTEQDRLSILHRHRALRHISA